VTDYAQFQFRIVKVQLLVIFTDCYICQGSSRSGKTGKIQGICVVRERSGKNIIFQKSGKMILDHAHYRYLWFFCVSKYLKADKFAASIEHTKARSVSASHGGLSPPSDSLTKGSVVRLLLHYTISLPRDIVYHFW